MGMVTRTVLARLGRRRVVQARQPTHHQLPGAPTRRARSEPGKYVLAGTIRCYLCGKSMYGATAKSKPYYRSSATKPDYASPSVPGHPPTYDIREERVLAALDGWLSGLTDDDHLDATVATILAADRHAQAEPADVKQARRQQKRLQQELDRLVAAIRAGMDPTLAAPETRRIQAEITNAALAVSEWERSNRRPGGLTEAQIRAALTEAGGLIRLLQRANRVDRAALYRALRLSLRYEKEAATGQEKIHARLQLTRSGGRI